MLAELIEDSAASLRSEDHAFRSRFVRNLIQRTRYQRPRRPGLDPVPRNVVQFWDNALEIPTDVTVCMDSWRQLEAAGFALLRFDDVSARRFVIDNFEAPYLRALDACYHPAMRSDYFRLCYISAFGGCYIDADDSYSGEGIADFFEEPCLTLQPLCYDCASGCMVPPHVFTRPEADSRAWIFYFNNNPLIAPRRHPVVVRALSRATRLLTENRLGELPDIQSTTGPGNLTASLVAETLISDENGSPLPLRIASHWEEVATSVWPLSYRTDRRNWRLSNRQRFLRHR